MTSTGEPQDAQNDRHELIDTAARKALAKLADELRIRAGRRAMRLIQESGDEIYDPYDGFAIEERLTAAIDIFSQLIEAFVVTVGRDTIDRLISVRGETPEVTRLSVISWLKFLTPLADQVATETTPSYRPPDLIQSLLLIRPEILQDALWAPNRALASRAYKSVACDELLAVSIHHHLVGRGYDKDLVRDTLFRHYGVIWDTMRKWETRATNILGKEASELILSGEGGMPPFNDWIMIDSFIYVAGSAYQRRAAYPKIKRYEGAEALTAYLKR